MSLLFDERGNQHGAYVHVACTNSREIYSPRIRRPRCTQLRDREYSAGNSAALQNGQFRRDSPAITYYMTRRRHFVAIARDQELEIPRRWTRRDAARRMRGITSSRHVSEDPPGGGGYANYARVKKRLLSRARVHYATMAVYGRDAGRLCAITRFGRGGSQRAKRRDADSSAIWPWARYRF